MRCSCKSQAHQGAVPALTVPGIDLTTLVDAVADRVVAKLHGAVPHQMDTNEPLLLTLEQAARKLGRTVPAVEHLIRDNKLPAVRFDRRIFIDHRDILALIERSKS